MPEVESHWLKKICLVSVAVAAVGCHHKGRVHVTALPLSPQNQCEPEGIPYYLPKPLLVISKNVRHIDESKVGLTTPAPIPNAFDDQSSYGSIKANVTVPSSSGGTEAINAGGTQLPGAFGTARSSVQGLGEQLTPNEAVKLGDDISPDSFFTYQIVFVPDLSQKYVLRIKGGAGEMRAAMNIVNGWMYTGLGPYYMKDSSKAQNMMARGVGAMFAGRGVADVISEVGDLAQLATPQGAGSGVTERAAADADDIIDKYTKLARALQSETVVAEPILNYAEIYIYEPTLMDDGSMSWSLIAEHHFDRDYFQPKMNPNAMELFKSIIGQHALQEKGEIERARADEKEQRQLERARADAILRGQIERAASDALPAATGNPDALPAAIGGGSSVAQPVASQPLAKRVFEEAAMKQFGIADAASSSQNAPQTQVNVNMAPETTEARKGYFGKGLLGLFHRDPPKVESRANRLFDLSPTTIASPNVNIGSGVTSPGTLTGSQP